MKPAKRHPGPPTAIVVDDDSFLLKGLDYGLRKIGIVPTLTEDPDEFMARVSADRYDLYLIDLQLGNGRSGLDLIEQFRASQGTGPRVIMVSATGDTRTIAEALARGANDYILKPLDREHLAAKLSRYVSTPLIMDATYVKGGGLEGRAPAKLSFQVDVLEVNDHGIRLQSPHFMPKGTPVWLDGELLKELSGDDPRLTARAQRLLKVTSAWVESDDGSLCGAYAEFDRGSGDPRWFRAIRRWLAAQHK
jgi:DNA-binding response OmpR family regulator